MRRRTLLSVLALAACALPANALEIAETRGDFHYDRDGNFVAMRHVDAPVTDTREPASFAQRFAEAGIQLPPAGRAVLEPRLTRAKSEVVLNEQSRQDEIIVKFVEGREVRMRSGRLLADGASVPELTGVLARWTGVSVQRMFDLDEAILDDNKRTGELISGRELADLNNYFVVRLADPSPRLAELANEILALDIVETAYVRAQPQPSPACADVAPTTPLWEASQSYLTAAPAGIDTYYAWSYHAGGNGAGPGFWVIDMEYDWCLNHEDLDVDAADAVTGLADGPYNTPEHGTAVLGIYGACDNAYGMTGMTSDVSLKLLDTHVHGVNYAVCVAQAASYLLPGEVMLIEQQTGGPSGELLPVEWGSATWDAIATATANGIVVVEAAANGAVNLDSSTYGGWFSTGHDSGALLVGAGAPGSHNKLSFSNYGSTVDLHGYGSGVYSTGYGWLFSPAGDCSQDYTNGFSGTSSASPMITGAAVALQGIANAKYGIDLAPWQVRSALRFGGTPQGDPGSGNIGPMPDLVNAINEIEPDLIPYQAPGWTGALVPRGTDDATLSNVTVPTGALPGNTSSTYLNWTVRNNPSAWAPAETGWINRVYLEDDGLYFGTSGATPFEPGAWGGWVNIGPSTIKGGRHTLTILQDADDVIAEWIETNNEWSRQHVWSPRVMAPDLPVSATDDPVAASQNYVLYNAEGLQGTAGSQYWHVFAVMPTNASDDFDIRLNAETPMNVPLQGFGVATASSYTPSGEISFVGFNRNRVAGSTYWASVLNFSGAGSANKMMEFEQDAGVLVAGENGPYSIGASDLVGVHELYLSAGQEYRIHVEWTGGGADYGMSVFDRPADFFDKTDTMTGGYSDDRPAFEDEFTIVAPDSTGYHGLVVWKKGSADLYESLTYNVHVSTLPNLVGQEPSGWYGPIVPREDQDAPTTNVPLPPTLPGNIAGTSFNYVVHNEGANAAPGTESDLRLDDAPIYSGLWTSLASGFYGVATNLPFETVRGGRHHARSIADPDGNIVEFDETDNVYDEAFVWTPLELADHVPVTRSAMALSDPPGYWWFSCDGFRSLQEGTYWEGVAVMPVNGAETYGVRIHEPSTGSLDGFDANLAADYGAPGRPAIALTNFNQVAWQDWDYGVLSLDGAVGDFVVQKSTAPLVMNVSGGTSEAGPYTIPAGTIFDLYEIHVDSPAVGIPLYLTLDVLSGNADLTLAFFDQSGGFLRTADATYLVNDAGTGGDEHVTMNLASSGFYGIAVVKSDSGELANAADYRLVIGTTNATGVDVSDAVPASFALAAPSPNPFAGDTAIRFDVPAGGGNVRLEVFDLQGRRVATLADGFSPAGRHSARWDGRDSGGRRSVAGVYFVRLQTPKGGETRKITLLN